MRASSVAAAASRDPAIIRLPAVDEISVGEVSLHLARIRDALPEFRVDVSSRLTMPAPKPPRYGEMFAMAVLLVETVLEQRREDTPHECHAELAVLLTLPSIPEQAVLQIAFGREMGERHMRKIARLLRDARRAGMSADDYVAELSRSDGLPPDGLVRRFRGEWKSPPSFERAEAGIALLRHTAALVPDVLRPPLLCGVAWLQWALGRRAIAASNLAEALRIEPGNVLAAALQTHIMSVTPKWLSPRRA